MTAEMIREKDKRSSPASIESGDRKAFRLAPGDNGKPSISNNAGYGFSQPP
jgi:hypothetical protein